MAENKDQLQRELTEDRLLQLDLDAILRKRLGDKSSRLPRFATRFLEKLICQNELNDLLRQAYPNRGSAFSEVILKALGDVVEVDGLDRLPSGKRYIFASNHPLGGLDGIALIMVLGKWYGDKNVRFLVNDMLMNVEPLKDMFLPINKYGGQAREAARSINDTYASDGQILIFPAGLVSRLGDDGEIRDLEWHKAFVSKAIEYKRDIVPVRFEALNRKRFYRVARWRKKLGLKVNIEQIFLPGELCNSRNKKFRISFLAPITYQSLKEDKRNPREIADSIRKLVN